MAAEYERAAASVSTLTSLATVPRTKDPVRLMAYALGCGRMSSEIASVAKSVDARLIHTFNEITPAGGIAARRLRIPSVVHVLGMTMFEPRAVGAAWSRVLRQLSTRIVACQDLIAEKLTCFGVPPEQVAIVYNAIDVRKVREAAAGSPLTFPPGTVRVGTVGGMDRRKGHLDLIAAARRVRAEDSSVKFYWIGSTSGDDGYHESIRREITESGLTDSFELVGAVPDAAPWIGAMDIYCIPSRSEALSVAGLEAMSLGLPTVATDVGGNGIAIEEGATGLLSRPGDAEDLADKILRLVRDRRLREDLGRRAAKDVERRFSIETSAAALGKVFDEALHPPRPRGSEGCVPPGCA